MNIHTLGHACFGVRSCLVGQNMKPFLISYEPFGIFFFVLYDFVLFL